jgi:hypothetical protein
MRNLRQGMWVRFNDKIGILDKIQNGGCEVHLTNDAGETEFVVLAGANQLQQATLNDIPEPRRPSPEFGASLGYF